MQPLFFTELLSEFVDRLGARGIRGDTTLQTIVLTGLRFHTDGAVLQLATEARLASVVADINSHHQAVAHVDNPSPVWMKDMLLNQFSHFHML